MRTTRRASTIMGFLGIVWACHGSPDATTASAGGGTAESGGPVATASAASAASAASGVSSASDAERRIVIAPPSGTAPPSAPAAPTSAGLCKPSSVVSTTTCSRRAIPPSNASSPEGCKSDAECMSGIDGRCVDTGARDTDSELDTPSRPGAAANAFGAPLPRPPRTKCVYDQCTTNADCGTRARCACGRGAARNSCVPLDACLSDTDCGREMLCHCNAGGGANGCGAGNCRTDGDCGAGFSCTFAQSGDNYCHTSKDTCQSQRDCASPPGRVCDYDRAAKKWACRALPPAKKRPPG